MPIELELPNFVLLEESSRYLHLCVFVQKAILYHRPVYLREQQSYIAVQYIFARTAILYHRSVYLREQQSYIAVQYICANSNLISPFSIFARTAFLVLYFLLEPCSGPPLGRAFRSGTLYWDLKLRSSLLPAKRLPVFIL